MLTKRLLTISLALAFSLPVLAQVSLTQTGTPVTIDFTNTVAGVNDSVFIGANPFGTNPATPGFIDLRAWDIFLDGTAAQASQNPAQYPGRMPANAGGLVQAGTVTGGGIYATDIAMVNDTFRAMLFQPTGGAFSSGNLTLRLINNTGSDLSEIDLAYDLFIFNDQARGNSFNFSYSLTNAQGSYTAVPALDVQSPTTADPAPQWVQHAKNTTLTGFLLTIGDTMYLRWILSDVAGSGVRDEFALTNISLRGTTPTGIEVNLSADTLRGSEANQDTIRLTLTASSPVPSAQQVEVTVGGDMLPGTYILSNTLMVLNQGDSVVTIDFIIVDDILNEGLHQAIISITNPSQGIFIGASNSVTIDIIDNDDAVRLAQLDVFHPTLDFDNLANTGNNNAFTYQGSYLLEAGFGANNMYRADDGTQFSGDTYSYGSTGSTERAFGSLTSGSVRPVSLGFLVVNETGAPFNTLDIEFTGEQWRSGTASGDTLHFGYSTTNTSLADTVWTSFAALNFASIHASQNSALDGNLPANQTVVTATLTGFPAVPNGGSIWLRWIDFDVVGGDDGMAIDDLKIKPSFVIAPEVTITGTVQTFIAQPGSSSATQMLTVAGTNLTDDITVTIDNEFEIALSGSGNWTDTIVLAHTGGTISPTDIDIRFSPTVAGSWAGTLSASSAGATTVTRTLNGVSAVLPQLYINELLADNDTTFADPNNEYDPWIEIFNPNNHSVDLSGMYISNNPGNPMLYQFPSGDPENIIAANGFKLVWADNQPSQGALHTNFTLNVAGGFVGLYFIEGSLIDSVTYGPQSTDVSYGRDTDGGLPWTTFSRPTPGASNIRIGIGRPDMKPLTVWPSLLTDDAVYLSRPMSATVYNISGQTVLRFRGTSFSPATWPSGTYLLHTTEGHVVKLVKP